MLTDHLSLRERHTTDAPYPHQALCGRCLDLKLCTVCGTDLRQDRSRCTNGHCCCCHSDCCTPGGMVGPGHAPGSPETRTKAYGRRVAEQSRQPRQSFDERRANYSGPGRNDL